jgi:hypothetical protein
MAATESVAAAPSPAEIVERERRIGPRVGLTSLAAAILCVLGGVLPQSIYSDSPRVYVLDSLRDAAGQPIGRPGLKTAEILFLNDKATALLIVAIIQALLIGAIGYILINLLRAALDRGGRAPAAARLLVLFGAVGGIVGALGLQIALMVQTHDFANSADQSTKAARDVLHAGGVVAFSAVGSFATLALAGGFVLIALAAMRVGLLTRFVGVLGAIVGALLVLGPLAGAQVSFIVEAFWLAMIGALWLGRWPSGLPPAWSSGEAHPWPTQQEIREQRMAARGQRPAPRGKPSATVAEPAEQATEAPSPATSKKKKRKRRG